MTISITSLLGFFKELILLAMDINGIKVTKRELEILKMLSRGLSSKQIASELHISVTTVKDHRKSLLVKLSANNVAELCFKAAKYINL